MLNHRITEYSEFEGTHRTPTPGPTQDHSRKWSRDDLPSYHHHHFMESATSHDIHDYLPEPRIGAGIFLTKLLFHKLF